MATYGPWHIDIRAWQAWISTQGTWDRTNGIVGNTSATIGDIIAWDVPLLAGTWTLSTMHQNSAADGASCTVKFDATTVATINMAASTGANVVTTTAGIVVAADGIVRLSYTAADAKVIRLQLITLSRTA